MNEDLMLEKKLEYLRKKHREMDEQLQGLLAHSRAEDQLSIMRMKKEKLSVRDEIGRIEAILYPDLIA